MEDTRLTSGEFEDILLYRMRREERAGRGTMSRYGVQGAFVDGKWQPIKSLPDFTGCIPPEGREFIIEAKVCSEASFSLHDEKFKERQLRHLLVRARFGAASILMIHFNPRHLSAREIPAETIAFPIHPHHEFWRSFDRGEVKRISREAAIEYGFVVPWNLGDGNKPRPDVLAAVEATFALLWHYQLATV